MKSHGIQTLALPATLLLATACGSAPAGPQAPVESSLCGDAASHVQSCFGGGALAVGSCSTASAERVLSMSCGDLAQWGQQGKADDPWACFWLPWYCADDSGESDTDDTMAEVAKLDLEISVEECGESPLDDCPYVQSVACAEVALLRGDEVIDRGHTNVHGRLTFTGLEAGDYVVRVLDRKGGTPEMEVGDFLVDIVPAEQKVTLAEDPERDPWEDEVATWSRFRLLSGSTQSVRACSSLRGRVDFVDAAGENVDRKKAEWRWLVLLETDDEVLDISRPFFVHHEATRSGDDENILGFSNLYPGEYFITFVPMDIPGYAQRNNPDYERLLRWYEDERFERISYVLNIDADDVGPDIQPRVKVTDPRTR